MFSSEGSNSMLIHLSLCRDNLCKGLDRRWGEKDYGRNPCETQS